MESLFLRRDLPQRAQASPRFLRRDRLAHRLLSHSRLRHFPQGRESCLPLIPSRSFPTRIPGLPKLQYVLQARQRMSLDDFRPAAQAARLQRDAGLARSCGPAIRNLQRLRPTGEEERLAAHPAQASLGPRVRFAVRLPGVEARGRQLRSARYSCPQAVVSMWSRRPAAVRRARAEVREQGLGHWIGRQTEEQPDPADPANFGAAVRGMYLAAELLQNSAASEQGE